MFFVKLVVEFIDLHLRARQCAFSRCRKGVEAFLPPGDSLDR